MCCGMPSGIVATVSGGSYATRAGPSMRDRRTGGAASMSSISSHLSTRSMALMVLPGGPEESALSAADDVAALFLVAALIVLVGAVALLVKIYKLGRKREKDASALEARLFAALHADPSFSDLAVVPTVRMPLWQGTPRQILLTGSVPRPQLRQAAAESVVQVATRSAQRYRIEDRIVIGPEAPRKAA